MADIEGAVGDDKPSCAWWKHHTSTVPRSDNCRSVSAPLFLAAVLIVVVLVVVVPGSNLIEEPVTEISCDTPYVIDFAIGHSNNNFCLHPGLTIIFIYRYKKLKFIHNDNGDGSKIAKIIKGNVNHANIA